MFLHILLYFYFLAQPANSLCNYESLFTKTFKSCWPRQSLIFPADFATCECKYCPIQMNFSCFRQKVGNFLTLQKINYRWALDENQQRCSDCMTSCPPSNDSEEFHCSNNKRGYKNEIRECTCKSNCLKTSISCGADRIWTQTNKENPCSQNTFNLQENGTAANIDFKSGQFVISCKPGYATTTEGWVTCIDGEMSQKLPICELQQDDPIPENSIPILEIILGTLFVLASTAIIIYIIIRRRNKSYKREMVDYDDVQNTMNNIELSNIPPITRQMPSNADGLSNQDPDYLVVLETNNYEYITCKNGETSNPRVSNLYSTINEASCSQNVGNYEVPVDLKERKSDQVESIQEEDDENHYEVINEFKATEIQ